MKLWTHVTVVMLVGLLAAPGLHARSGGTGGGGGGGHGGTGGHGGRGGRGGFSSGRSSGGSVGHAMGHAFGRLFGRGGKVSSSAHDGPPGLAGAALVHGRIVQLPGPQDVSSPALARFPQRPVNDFPYGERLPFFRPRRRFGFGGCADFGFPLHRFLFDDDFNCFAGGLLFDPLFIAEFSRSSIGGPAPVVSWGEPGPGETPGAADRIEDEGRTQNDATNHAASADKAKSEQTVTLLQLHDGSMYGLVDYWVADGQLHYTTTYGGQNSLELDRIDMEKTIQLNAERGVQFALHPKSPPR